MERHKPTPPEIRAAVSKTVPDVIAANLKVLFVGINPGLYSAAIGHHFGRPGNRFWPALYLSGITPRLFDPEEDALLLPLGYGITNIVPRATATADQLTKQELQVGGRRLEEKIAHYQPNCVAVLGVGAYRSAFNLPKAQIGLQPEPLAGSRLWILPNPSGLNAHYNLEELAESFKKLKENDGDERHQQ